MQHTSFHQCFKPAQWLRKKWSNLFCSLIPSGQWPRTGHGNGDPDSRKGAFSLDKKNEKVLLLVAVTHSTCGTLIRGETNPPKPQLPVPIF